MTEWTFGWDAIAALAGVGAVVVASVLGWMGIRVAAKSVERTSLDYVATRADRLTDILAEIAATQNAIESAIIPLVMWAGNPQAPRPSLQPFNDAATRLHALEIPLESTLNSLDVLRPAPGEPLAREGETMLGHLAAMNHCLWRVLSGTETPHTEAEAAALLQSTLHRFALRDAHGLMERAPAAWEQANGDVVKTYGIIANDCMRTFYNWGLGTARSFYGMAAGDIAANHPGTRSGATLST